MIKQRRESLAIFKKAGRTELAAPGGDRDRRHRGVPPQADGRGRGQEAIAAAIKETGAAGPKDMGKVMAR